MDSTFLDQTSWMISEGCEEIPRNKPLSNWEKNPRLLKHLTCNSHAKKLDQLTVVRSQDVVTCWKIWWLINSRVAMSKDLQQRRHFEQQSSWMVHCLIMVGSIYLTELIKNYRHNDLEQNYMSQLSCNFFCSLPPWPYNRDRGEKETDPCSNIQMVAYPSRWIAVLSTRQLDVHIASRHQSLAQDFPPIKTWSCWAACVEILCPFQWCAT